MAGSASGPQVVRMRRVGRMAFLFAGFALLGTHSPMAQTAASPAGRFVVVLDPAHGGTDLGATVTDGAGKPHAEKNLALAFSVKLRSLVAARAMAVATTRESDTTIEAQQRAAIANHARAQACLTLHASMSGSGIHLFISSLPPARPTQFEPWQTAQAAWVQRSVRLAGVLNSALLHAGMKVTLSRTALTTVDSMACPAVAVEIAPEAPTPAISAARSVDDPAYLAQVADALAAGLLEWRAEAGQP